MLRRSIYMTPDTLPISHPGDYSSILQKAALYARCAAAQAWCTIQIGFNYASIDPEFGHYIFDSEPPEPPIFFFSICAEPGVVWHTPPIPWSL
jgi:hypothetical protein